jgi:hypothetical protein
VLFSSRETIVCTWYNSLGACRRRFAIGFASLHASDASFCQQEGCRRRGVEVGSFSGLPSPSPTSRQLTPSSAQDGGFTTYGNNRRLATKTPKAMRKKSLMSCSPATPLLCCAKTNEEFATRRREVWRGKLSQLPLIVPNWMLSVKGPTQGGWLSEHSKAATARRVYLCIEFDFCEKAWDGVTDTIVAPLVQAWHKDGIEIIEARAALILHLRDRLSTLASACHSGGKSLHAWFRVLERNQAETKKLYAVRGFTRRRSRNLGQV